MEKEYYLADGRGGVALIEKSDAGLHIAHFKNKLLHSFKSTLDGFYNIRRVGVVSILSRSGDERGLAMYEDGVSKYCADTELAMVTGVLFKKYRFVLMHSFIYEGEPMSQRFYIKEKK